jgi:hypothetical protein
MSDSGLNKNASYWKRTVLTCRRRPEAKAVAINRSGDFLSKMADVYFLRPEIRTALTAF